MTRTFSAAMPRATQWSCTAGQSDHYYIGLIADETVDRFLPGAMICFDGAPHDNQSRHVNEVRRRSRVSPARGLPSDDNIRPQFLDLLHQPPEGQRVGRPTSSKDFGVDAQLRQLVRNRTALAKRDYMRLKLLSGHRAGQQFQLTRRAGGPEGIDDVQDALRQEVVSMVLRSIS